jgi:hypothetical protein
VPLSKVKVPFTKVESIDLSNKTLAKAIPFPLASLIIPEIE